MPFDGGDHKNLIRQISNGDYKEPTQSSGTEEIYVCFILSWWETQLVPMAIIKLLYKLYSANVVRPHQDSRVSEVHHFPATETTDPWHFCL